MTLVPDRWYLVVEHRTVRDGVAAVLRTPRLGPYASRAAAALHRRAGERVLRWRGDRWEPPRDE